MDRLYRILTSTFSPLITLWLVIRRARGKEDRERFAERFGRSRIARPKGTLAWFHAASVGEANSVLLLIDKIRERFPAVHILLTTGTVTSAQLMAKRLPKGAIHQFVPVDTPEATRRFMHHWKPDIAFWVESEFWPNLVRAANRYYCFMGVINARLSERSLATWKRYPAIIQSMLSSFNIIFAQSEEDAMRIKELGGKDVLCLGNLKYDAALLPCSESELLALKGQLAGRPLWLAASTHPQEEAMIAKAHTLLAATRPNLLTVIVPRHPDRGPQIADELSGYKVALRSKKQPIAADTQIYIADTLGELGLFYRLCEIAFMGGSLVRHGGQNPLEPARLACAIITGPHTHNFTTIYADLERMKGSIRIHSAKELAAQVDQLMNNSGLRTALEQNAKQWVERQSGTAARLLDMLSPIFTIGSKAA